MTTEEAIKTLEVAIAEVEWEYPMNYAVAFEMAIAALHAQQEREKNEPLTLDELQQMDGEPVWLEIASGVWGLVDTDDEVVWLDRGGSVSIRALYGKAYRHKPKEADK